ncbi:MAG: acyl-CoA dehydrogenase family protein [Sphingomonas sp.]
MDFDLSDEQRLLADSVGGFVADRYDFEHRRRTIASAAGWSRETWRAMAELGLTGLPFAEEDGGFGGGGAETMLVMEALGRGLVVEPYFASVVLAGGSAPPRRDAGAEDAAGALADRRGPDPRARAPRARRPAPHARCRQDGCQPRGRRLAGRGDQDRRDPRRFPPTS